MDLSQTFPLMNDEVVRPLVCVMSIAVFELWWVSWTMRGEKKNGPALVFICSTRDKQIIRQRDTLV